MSFQFFLGGRGGTILTNFLGGGTKYERKKFCVQKHKKSLFSKSEGQMAHPPAPPPNDVPEINTNIYINIPIYTYIFEILSIRNIKH